MYWTTPSGTRYQTGSPRVDAVAAVGRRDRQRRDLHERDPVGRAVRRAAVVQLVPGPGAADEVGQLEQLVGVPPGEDLGRASAPVMKNSSASGAAPRAGRAACRWCRSARPVDVDPADREPRVRRGRDDRHQVAVLGRARRPGRPSATAARSGRRRPRRGRTTPATSLAATRWPWWIGSNVPPMTPTRGAGSPLESPVTTGSAVLASGAEDAQCDAAGASRIPGRRRRPARRATLRWRLVLGGDGAAPRQHGEQRRQASSATGRGRRLSADLAVAGDDVLGRWSARAGPSARGRAASGWRCRSRRRSRTRRRR